MEPRNLYEAPAETRRGGTLKVWWLIREGELRSNINFVAVCLIEANIEIQLHNHPEEEVFYFLSGIGVVTVEGKAYKVKEGDAIFIPSNVMHTVKNVGSHPLRYLVVSVKAA